MQRGFRRLRVWSTANRSSSERRNRRSVHIHSIALDHSALMRPRLTYLWFKNEDRRSAAGQGEIKACSMIMKR